MNLPYALQIGNDILSAIAPACEESMIGGGCRRCKMWVHDLEILAKPIERAPRPEFGRKIVFKTLLDKALHDLELEGKIMFVGGKDKKKTYAINLPAYSFDPSEPFRLEVWIVTGAAQWGLETVIRTGPGSDEDNFSKWVVTNREKGGCLLDGYKVRDLAVWRTDQIDTKSDKPRRGEIPLPMPKEIDFLDFAGLGWIEPKDRHARWKMQSAISGQRSAEGSMA